MGDGQRNRCRMLEVRCQHLLSLTSNISLMKSGSFKPRINRRCANLSSRHHAPDLFLLAPFENRDRC